jgi:hypothetical protein
MKMIHIITFLLGTKPFCRKMKPIVEEETRDWMVYSDSDWAWDVENQISVTVSLTQGNKYSYKKLCPI